MVKNKILHTKDAWSTSSSVVLQNMAIISTAKVWVLNIRRLQIHSIFLFFIKMSLFVVVVAIIVIVTIAIIIITIIIIIV